jgi:hypothetical protein
MWENNAWVANRYRVKSQRQSCWLSVSSLPLAVDRSEFRKSVRRAPGSGPDPDRSISHSPYTITRRLIDSVQEQT